MDVETGTQMKGEREYTTKTQGARKPWSGGYGVVEDKSTWVRVRPSNKYLLWAELSFNPVVTFVSLVIILAFSIWAIMLPEEANAEFAAWKFWIGTNFSWLYIGATVSHRYFN